MGDVNKCSMLPVECKASCLQFIRATPVGWSSKAFMNLNFSGIHCCSACKLLWPLAGSYCLLWPLPNLPQFCSQGLPALLGEWYDYPPSEVRYPSPPSSPSPPDPHVCGGRDGGEEGTQNALWCVLTVWPVAWFKPTEILNFFSICVMGRYLPFRERLSL